MNYLLVTSYALSCLGILAAVFGLGLYLNKRLGVSWKWWAYGVLVFLVFQGVLRIPWTIALPQMDWFRDWVKSPANQWIWIIFLCITAGLFEEGGRWVGYRFLFKPDDRVWKNALMFGAGHGGLEALGIALLQFSGAANYVLLHLVDPAVLRIPPEKAAEAMKQFSGLQGWEPLLGLWERLSSISVHLALSVVVLQAFRGRPMWLLLSITAHALTNLAVVGCLIALQKHGYVTTAMILPEVVATIIGALALWVTLRLRDLQPPSLAAAG